MDKKTEKWSPTGTSQILIDACTDSIIILDKDKYIIAWNKKNEILTGFTSNDILGKQYLDIYPATSDKEKVVQALDDALMGIHTFLPADSSSTDGSYHETHYLPLKEENIIVGIYIIRHDVTHRIKAENELRALNKALARKNNELKRLNEDILTFSKVTSYNFKDPARKAYDILELVLTNDTSLMETTRHYLKRIQSKLQRMNLLADDVLAYGQLQQVREPLSDVDINTVLKAVIQELQETIQSKAAIISIEELPIIKGYPQLLKQLFRNILSNALKFQKVGNAPLVTVTSGIHKGDEIRHTDALPGIQYARISFEDNGIGFNEKFKEKIFNMFYRLLPQEYFGSGIGLAICRKVAEVHNGFIIASSIPNQGSKIDCYLPLSQ